MRYVLYKKAIENHKKYPLQPPPSIMEFWLQKLSKHQTDRWATFAIAHESHSLPAQIYVAHKQANNFRDTFSLQVTCNQLEEFGDHTDETDIITWKNVDHQNHNHWLGAFLITQNVASKEWRFKIACNLTLSEESPYQQIHFVFKVLWSEDPLKSGLRRCRKCLERKIYDKRGNWVP